jgi:hypothetical protein
MRAGAHLLMRSLAEHRQEQQCSRINSSSCANATFIAAAAQVRLAALLQLLAPHAMSAADFRRLFLVMQPHLPSDSKADDTVGSSSKGGAASGGGVATGVWAVQLAKLQIVGSESGNGGLRGTANDATQRPVLSHTSLLAQRLLCRYASRSPAPLFCVYSVRSRYCDFGAITQWL